jgi:hypothetical protein
MLAWLTLAITANITVAAVTQSTGITDIFPSIFIEPSSIPVSHLYAGVDAKSP